MASGEQVCDQVACCEDHRNFSWPVAWQQTRRASPRQFLGTTNRTVKACEPSRVDWGEARSLKKTPCSWADRAAGDDGIPRGSADLRFDQNLAIGQPAFYAGQYLGYDIAHRQRRFAAERRAQRFSFFGRFSPDDVLAQSAFESRDRQKAVDADAAVAIADLDAQFVDVAHLSVEQANRHTQF